MHSELARLNSATRPEAAELMRPLVERSPWVVDAALEARPFESDETLAATLVEIILRSGPERRVALFNAHPELGGTEARAGLMTPSSMGEQGRLGLHLLAGEESARLTQLNSAYSTKFSHPFIVALHRITDKPALFDHFEARLQASPIEEHLSTLAEITSVIRSRCRTLFGSDVIEQAVGDYTVSAEPSASES